LRVANLIALGLLAGAAALAVADSPASARTTTLSNDCAVIAAIAKEHRKLSPENAPPPLKPGGDEGWRPRCDFSAPGIRFTDCWQPMPGSDPRQSLKCVAFQKPVCGGGGASVLTEIMHGPLAGIGYECRLISGFAGRTVGERKTSWVS